MRAVKPVGVIKKLHSDFQVFESGLSLCFETSIFGATSDYTRFALTKRGMENDPAMAEVAKQLRVPLEAISSCGRKDSFAETVQEIVVAGPFSPTFAHDRLWLQQLGSAAGPLWFGGHRGNTFSIKVYTDYPFQIHGQTFRNYFGHQRFGGVNVEAGRFLIEGAYAQAYDAWQGTREQVYRDRRAAMPFDGRLLTKVEVVAHPDLREACKRSVQAWQSHLWNELARVTKVLENRQTLPFWTEDTAHLYEDLWDPAFVTDEMLVLAHSLNRPLMAVARNMRSERESDGWRYQFTLGSGSYATVFLGSHFDLIDASVERYKERREAFKAST